ncbi:MAG TPA: chloride channel protein [Acidimicrobiales bacterium]
MGRPLPTTASWPRRVHDWLRGTSTGLAVLAIAVGLGAGAGAVAFRYLILGFTILFTGRHDYSLADHMPSPHFPGLGMWFLLLVPVIAGLIYGPIIQRFAKEARGHGVPEVMLAVSERGGRIGPAVAAVKSLASALCIGGGGSVGREGPIVQIGSALGSSLGQGVRVPESRLRVLVACGAAGGISATFNAPIAGVFFALELILRDFGTESFGVVVLASVAAAVVGRAAFGNHPFLTLPGFHQASPVDYLFFVALGLLAAVVGVAFIRVLYGMEDLFDRFWPGPTWLRPATGGLLLGLLLLGLPEMYGVGYPVLQAGVGGHYATWFLVVLLLGKLAAVSLTIAIGGSGGVFAPSLFMGAMLGTAFGAVVGHIIPGVSGPAADYGLVGMGAVFAGAARAPITAVLIIFELTGDYGVILPLMLAIAVATAFSTVLSGDTIYTLKLRRRGIDIMRGRSANVMEVMTVSDAMQPVPAAVPEQVPLNEVIARLAAEHKDALPVVDQDIHYRGAITTSQVEEAARENSLGATAGELARAVSVLRPDQSLNDALKALVQGERSGLPVLGPDGDQVVGWLTPRDVLLAYSSRLGSSVGQAEQHPDQVVPQPRSPGEPVVEPELARLQGYRVVDLELGHGAPPVGHRIDDLEWPPSSVLIAIRRDAKAVGVSEQTRLREGDHLTLVVPAASADDVSRLVDEVRPAGDGRNHADAGKEREVD